MALLEFLTWLLRMPMRMLGIFGAIALGFIGIAGIWGGWTDGAVLPFALGALMLAAAIWLVALAHGFKPEWPFDPAEPHPLAGHQASVIPRLIWHGLGFVLALLVWLSLAWLMVDRTTDWQAAVILLATFGGWMLNPRLDLTLRDKSRSL